MTPQALFRHVDLKVQRAHTQSHGLAARMGAFAEEISFTATASLLPDRMGHHVMLGTVDVQPFLDSLDLEFGEMVHNLRSSLDNLAYALACLKRDPPTKPQAITFPIYESSKKYAVDAKRAVQQMNPDAAELLERLQPFQRDRSDVEGTPSADPLFLLHQLSNTDKHRKPHFTVVAPREIKFSSTVEFYTDEDATRNIPPKATFWADELKTGVPLLVAPTDCAIASVQGTYEITAILQLRSAELHFEIEQILRQLPSYVGLVVNEFRTMFQ